jgi:hypothetical protein
MKRLLAVLVFTVLLVPGTSEAQIQPNSWLGVVNVNWNVATIKDFGSTISGLGFGVQIDRVLGGQGSVSLGIQANYVNVDGTISEQVQAQVGTETLRFAAETKGAPIAVYGRYMFGSPGVRGYVGVGPGIFIGETTVQPEDEPAQSQSTTKFAGMAMAGGFFKMGTKVWLNAGVSLFLVPDSELFTDNTWAGSLGLVIPIGNP